MRKYKKGLYSIIQPPTKGNSMGKKVYVECQLEWTRLREDNRDMGPEDGSDLSRKIESKQGQYIVDCLISDEEEKTMLEQGVPNKGLHAGNWKTNKEGNRLYKAKRGHFNPMFKDKDTGEMGVVTGPPKVFKLVDGEYLPWDWETDGLIGNGSKATVKLDVYKDRVVTMEKVCINELVVYEAEEEGGF